MLGATNLRTFIYGPWQRYAHGTLNILTSPAPSSSVNGATLYTQKKIFDSVDPLALTYVTYYNGKVLYEDIFDSLRRRRLYPHPNPHQCQVFCLVTAIASLALVFIRFSHQ